MRNLVLNWNVILKNATGKSDTFRNKINTIKKPFHPLDGDKYYEKQPNTARVQMPKVTL